VRIRSQAEPPVGGPRATAATSDNAATAGPLHGGRPRRRNRRGHERL